MKHSFLLIFFSFFESSLTAQHFWGLSVGPNLSQIHDNRGNWSASKAGFNLHGFHDLSIGKHFGLQTEFGYTMVGTEADGLHNLTLPVVFYYALIEKIRIGAGGQGGVLLNDMGRKFDGGVVANLEFKPNDRMGIQVRNYFGLAYDRISPDDYRIIDGGDPLINQPSHFHALMINTFQINFRYYFGKDGWY